MKKTLLFTAERIPDTGRRARCFVYFNREGQLVAKGYFDDEWKVSHDSSEGKGQINFLKMSQWTTKRPTQLHSWERVSGCWVPPGVPALPGP